MSATSASSARDAPPAGAVREAMHRRRAGISGTAALALLVVIPLGAVRDTAVSAPAATTPAAAPAGWRLVSSETFGSLSAVTRARWVRDPHGVASPWNVDHLDDDGQFFDVQGGADFRRHLAAADVVRKRVTFGSNGWLTVELAARDDNKDLVPENPPSLRTVTLRGQAAGRLASPGHDSGVIVRNTQPLPERYRIEYFLRSLDFGGKRSGSWLYDNKVNGYPSTGCRTNWPWKRSGVFTGPADRCNSNFGDVRAENGFYFLAVMDYDKPAPHNNVLVHNHRKVGMDVYNVSGAWSQSYAVCNPATGLLMEYQDSTTNAVNSIFFDGSRFRAPEIGYNQFVMPTECGVRDGADPEATIVSAAETVPELLPSQSYAFAIERDATGYTTEMAGPFRHVGMATLRYHRDFVQDGRPIWHYNQTPEEYDGAFNTRLTFSGPFGSYTKDQWPAGSSYPDYFVIGDPHLNYYAGTATIDDLRMYVPSS